MRPMDPVRGRRKTARKELTHLPREDRRKTLSEKLKKNQPKRVDFPPQMAEFLLTEHTCRGSRGRVVLGGFPGQSLGWGIQRG